MHVWLPYGYPGIMAEHLSAAVAPGIVPRNLQLCTLHAQLTCYSSLCISVAVREYWHAVISYRASEALPSRRSVSILSLHLCLQRQQRLENLRFELQFQTLPVPMVGGSWILAAVPK